MIKSYGLFWRPDDVFWGRQKVPGALLGRRSGSAKNTVVDFRDQIGVYVLYQQFQVVYVGMAEGTRLLPRLRSHLTDLLQDRWDRFSWFGLLDPDPANLVDVMTTRRSAHGLEDDPGTFSLTTRSVIQHLEGLAIVAFEPPLNRQGPSFGDADRYVQLRHPCLGPTTDELIRAAASSDEQGNPCFRSC